MRLKWFSLAVANEVIGVDALHFILMSRGACSELMSDGWQRLDRQWERTRLEGGAQHVDISVRKKYN